MDGAAFGRGVRALRIRRRLTQEDLGARAGVSRGVIARIEQGRASALTVATLERAVAALGGRVGIRLSWQGEGLDRLLDGRHAATVEAVVLLLRRLGWDVATEVSFNVWGERGSIDVLAFHPSTRAVIVVEVKTAIGDAQELLATLDRKVRLAPTIGAARGWRPASISPLLVIVDSRTNRARIDRLAATFDTAVPDRNVAIRRWLQAPDSTRPIRGLWFLNTGPDAVVTQRVRKRRKEPPHGSPAGS